MAAQLAARYATLQARLEAAAQAAGRRPNDILLLGATKQRDIATLRCAHALGLRHFGENYLQEALPKIAALGDLQPCWHFIGALQSNKTALVAQHFHWVHSLDRLHIAERLSAQRPPELPPLEVCLQLQLDDEPNKAGATPTQLPALATAVATLPRLRLRGLMTMPAPRNDHAAQRRSLSRARELLQQLREQLPLLDTLSLGTSADLEAAVAEGSTLLRIGTALFGARQR